MKPARPCGLGLVLIVSALALGCSAQEAENEGTNEQGATASDVNGQQFRLDRLLTNVDAGRGARGHGVVRWDVYAGRHAQGAAKFEGAVFYASDPNGDVRYFFAFDQITKTFAVGQLDPEGRSVSSPIDRATLEALYVDIEMLRDRARSGGAGDCATGIGVAALTAVVTLGVSFVAGLPVAGALGIGASLGFAEGLGVAVVTTLGLSAGVSAAVGIAVGAAADVVNDCRLAARGDYAR